MANHLIEGRAAFLPADSALRRGVRAPRRRRAPEFYERYEDRALVYDAFWCEGGQTILLICPPPRDLAGAFRSARFAAEDGTILVPRFHHGPCVTVIALAGAPPGTPAITMTLGGKDYPIGVAANHSDELAGRRVLFTMSKDNPLEWISDWVAFHRRHHGVDAVIVFDNGSTRYPASAIMETLERHEGLSSRIVLDWPYRYGAHDPKVVMSRFWAHFVQNAAMSLVLRRFAARAQAILNLDIDEFAAPGQDGTSIFDACTASPQGLVVLRGRWVEAVAEPDHSRPTPRHRDFFRLAADPRQRRCGQKKWVLDPNRDWVRDLRVMPHVHWIENRPAGAKTTDENLFYWHFKGINTNWKDRRADAGDAATTVPDTHLARLLGTLE